MTLVVMAYLLFAALFYIIDAQKDFNTKTKMKLAALNCFNTRFHIDLVAVSLINAVERYTVDHVNSPV